MSKQVDGDGGQSVVIGDNSSRVSTFGVISTQGADNNSRNEMKTDSHAALKVNENDKEKAPKPSAAQDLIEDTEKEKEKEQKETKQEEDKDDQVTANMDIEIESDDEDDDLDEDDEEEEDDDVDDHNKMRRQRIAKLGKLMKPKELSQNEQKDEPKQLSQNKAKGKSKAKAKAKANGKGKEKGNEKGGKKEGKDKQLIKTLEFDRFESSYQLKSRKHGGIKFDLIKMNNNSRFIFVNGVSFDNDDSMEQEERFGEAIVAGDVISSIDYERKNVTDYNEIVNILQKVLANKNQHLSCNVNYFHLRIVHNGVKFQFEAPKLNKDLKDTCAKYVPKFGIFPNCLNDERVNEMLNDVESADVHIDDIDKEKALIYAYAAFSAFHVPKFKEDNYQVSLRCLFLFFFFF